MGRVGLSGRRRRRGHYWIRAVGCPLIGRLLSDVVLHSLCLGLPFLPCPVLVFLVFLELVSSSG